MEEIIKVSVKPIKNPIWPVDEEQYAKELASPFRWQNQDEIDEYLKKTKEAPMSKKNVMKVKVAAKPAANKGKSINSAIDEMLAHGATIGHITDRILKDFPKLAAKAEKKGRSYASGYVYTRLWDLKHAGRKVTKDGEGAEAVVRLLAK